MVVELRVLNLEDGEDIYHMLQHMGPGENGFGNSGYGLSYEEFQQYLERNLKISKGIGLTANQVPQTMYWLMADGKPLGMGKLREYLTDALLKMGGHIGYSIIPSERGKGYGTIMLKELLKEAAKKEIKEVLLTCNEDNISSKRVIEGNGGVLENIVDNKCRYWIRNYHYEVLPVK